MERFKRLKINMIIGISLFILVASIALYGFLRVVYYNENQYENDWTLESGHYFISDHTITILSDTGGLLTLNHIYYGFPNRTINMNITVKSESDPFKFIIYKATHVSKNIMESEEYIIGNSSMLPVYYELEDNNIYSIAFMPININNLTSIMVEINYQYYSFGNIYYQVISINDFLMSFFQIFSSILIIFLIFQFIVMYWYMKDPYLLYKYVKNKDNREVYKKILYSEVLTGLQINRVIKIAKDNRQKDFHSGIESLYPLIENYINDILKQYERNPRSCGDLYKKFQLLKNFNLFPQDFDQDKEQKKIRDLFLHGNWENIKFEDIEKIFREGLRLFSELIEKTRVAFE